MSYKFWSPEEENRLKKDYPTTPNKKLANKYDRTIDSIKSKAYEFELKKTYFGQEKEKEVIYLKEVYCEDCLEDPEGCGKSVEDCLGKEEAQEYIEGLEQDYIVKIGDEEDD